MRLADYPDQSSISTAIPAAVERPPDGASATGATATASLRPDLLEEARLLRGLGFGKPLILEHTVRATRNGTSLEAELLASGMVQSDTYYEALAELLGLPFLRSIDEREVLDINEIDGQLVRPEMLRMTFRSRPPVTAVVPSTARIGQFRAALAREPKLRAHLVVATPQAVRSAVWRAGAPRRSRETVNRLFDEAPQHSARLTFWGRQGFHVGAGLTALLFTAALAPANTILALHLVLTPFFLATLGIRFWALVRPLRNGATPTAPVPTSPRPVYSVFVALYREAAVARQLVAVLDRLDWPRASLDIKLICEADDLETLEALRSLPLGPHYEIVEVPPGLPRTKPKALSYALPAARGEFLVIYDAEDRPHPGQLNEAWATFRSAPDQLACLQAPLVISNGSASWVSALFSLEYAGLFRRLLPFLAAGRLPMPLGGTSNHFRTAALKRSGGWDPFNVTEDADLGMRLHRMGYRSATLRLPTLEDAPEDLRTWTGQRTRWFKGWLQTWLVLMRRPGQLAGDMGLLPFAVLQVLIGGLLLSSLAHPLLMLYVGYLGWLMAGDGPFVASGLAIGLFAVDFVNIFGSYAVFIALGLMPMSRQERASVGWRWLLVGAYWLMMSVAAWLAVAELCRKPFFWNKTAHRPTAPAPGETRPQGAGRLASRWLSRLWPAPIRAAGGRASTGRTN
ncbi:glycosyltransferase [Mycoplana dimorpha]|uniref:Cellulose synthase/poly-beta-1,6-N-acetylglucosamine synthase-like glycosyltransferase n=1 Tax=Mycoplana dimorpha TaxID=28320 RepID=A0A2T5BF42_MYCDI|nr:glycosyltransferase [Mycoplana dimorpha]PTM97607.1 cellulose synthase/poly-beta-1,6-N-acetylglucosamine synthase-like glycosyltransferase [Mycoplana dimorpha]